jgi:hypothetical protein
MVLAPHFVHFFVVGCNPNRATLLVLHIVGQFATQFPPKLLRVTGESKLGFGIVHDDDVAHGGAGSSAANSVAINNSNAHSTSCEFVGAGCTHNASAYNDNVVS